MNHKFLQQLTDFIFVEDLPENADIIFIPGSGFPQLGEEAAGLYHRDYASCILPSGRRQREGHWRAGCIRSFRGLN